MSPPTALLDETIRSRLDADGRISRDVSCVACSYNLRGIDHRNDCPECGRSAWDSLRILYLSDADPEWLRRMASGTVYLAILFGMLAAFLGFVLIMMSYEFYSSRGEPEWFMHMGVVFFISVATAGPVLGIRGAWLLSTVGHSEGMQKGVALSCFLVRLAVILGLSVLFVSILSQSDFLILASTGLCGAAGLLLFVRAARLAAKVPSVNVARQSFMVGFLLGISMAVACFVGFLGTDYGKFLVKLLDECVLYFYPSSVHGHTMYFGYPTGPISMCYVNYNKSAGNANAFVAMIVCAWASGLMMWYYRRMIEAAKVGRAAAQQRESSSTTA